MSIVRLINPDLDELSSLLAHQVDNFEFVVQIYLYNASWGGADYGYNLEIEKQCL